MSTPSKVAQSRSDEHDGTVPTTPADASLADAPSDDFRHPNGTGSGRLASMFLLAGLALALGIALLELDRLLVGVMMIAVMVFLMFGGVNISIAILASSALVIWRMTGISGLGASFEVTVFNSVASWSMTVVPLFMLMGFLISNSQIATGIYSAARNWFGFVPGGLAIGTCLSAASLASVSGSTVGIAYSVGRVAIPEMIRSGYKPSLATGAVTMSGTLGMMIPPSIVLVLYAGVAQTPVGPQLMAGLLPGAVLAVSFALLILLRSILQPSLAPRTAWSSVPTKERINSLWSVAPLAAIVGVVVGGMYFGFATATEAASLGVLTTIICVPFVSRELRSATEFGGFLTKTSVQTASAVGGILLLLVAAYVMTRAVALTGLAAALSSAVTELGLSRTGFLLALMVVYILLGMFLDTLAMMLVTFPVFHAPLIAYDVDLIWFGVFFVLMAEIGLVTPPLGILLYVVHNLVQAPDVNGGQAISLGTVLRGSMWFVMAALVVAIGLIFFPELATWLPGRMG